MINWKRVAIIAVLFLFAVFVQYGFLNNLGWGVLCPQLLIFFPIFAGILEGYKSGLVCGILCGLVQDLVIGRFVGVNILVWALIGLLIGIFSRRFFKENYLIPILAVVICFAAATMLYALLIGLISGYWFSMTRISQILLGGIFANGIIAPIIYLPVYRSLSYGILRRRSLEDENL